MAPCGKVHASEPFSVSAAWTRKAVWKERRRRSLVVKPYNNGAHFEFIVDVNNHKDPLRGSFQHQSSLQAALTRAFQTLVSLHGAYHKKPSPTAEYTLPTF